MFRLFALLPFPVLRGLCGFAAYWVRILRWRHSLLACHLERCLADRSAAERARIEDGFYRYLGDLLAEVLYAQSMPAGEVEARVRLENPEEIAGQLAAGGRVMILASHHCNWEWLLLRCSGAFGRPLTAAYKPASLQPADRALKRMRSRFGATLVPAKQIVPHLIEQRGNSRLLALLADQCPAASNEQQCWLKFFGQDTAFYQGPGWIATKFGYAVWFAAMRRESPGRYAVRFVRLDPAGGRRDPDAVLQAYACALEEHVRAQPVEYFWAYKRWKRDKRLYDA